MKHIVRLTISNPAHEHISLRRRQSTTNYMVEARDEAEAIFRASNHFKKLGNYVHNAVIAESALNESVEQIDEAVKVGRPNYDKSNDAVWYGVHHNGKEIGTIGTNYAKNVEKHGKWGFEDSRGYGRKNDEPKMNSKAEALKALVNRHKEYTEKKTNEEVEQIDELSKDTLRKYVKSAEADATNKNREATKNRLVGKRSPRHADAQATADALDRARNKRLDKMDLARAKMAKEEVEQIDEAGVMKKVGRAIAGWGAFDKDKPKDVVKNTKSMSNDALSKIAATKRGSFSFKKSPAALQQKVAKRELEKRSVSEEIEQIDELKKSTLASYITKASRQSSGLHSLGKEFDNDKHMYAQKALKARTPKTKEKAKADMETSGRLAKTFTRKAQNRTAGISRAAVKLAKEEVEQIDELSKKTLSSYVGKAYWDQGKRMAHGAEVYGYVAGKYGRKATRGEVFKNAKEMHRDKTRDTGVQRALSKLAKEEVERQVEPPPSAMPSDTRLKPLPKKGKRTTGSFNKFGHYTPGVREEVEQVVEKAPPGAKYERMVKHIKTKYSADGTLTPKEKAIAYATAWKAKNAGK